MDDCTKMEECKKILEKLPAKVDFRKGMLQYVIDEVQKAQHIFEAHKCMFMCNGESYDAAVQKHVPGAVADAKRQSGIEAELSATMNKILSEVMRYSSLSEVDQQLRVQLRTKVKKEWMPELEGSIQRLQKDAPPVSPQDSVPVHGHLGPRAGLRQGMLRELLAAALRDATVIAFLQGLTVKVECSAALEGDTLRGFVHYSPCGERDAGTTAAALVEAGLLEVMVAVTGGRDLGKHLITAPELAATNTTTEEGVVMPAASYALMDEGIDLQHDVVFTFPTDTAGDHSFCPRLQGDEWPRGAALVSVTSRPGTSDCPESRSSTPGAAVEEGPGAGVAEENNNKDIGGGLVEVADLSQHVGVVVAGTGAECERIPGKSGSAFPY